jgi:molecular chaperone GrpE
MGLPHNVDDEKVASEAVDVSTLMKENASLRDRMMRALAEAENTRRQADRAIADARKFAVADLARELLVVIDNLERTVEAAEKMPPTTPEGEALVEGVRATLRILIQSLERFGVTRIEALGQRFDPNMHEAVMQDDDPSSPPGTVTRVIEPGYMLRDRLLRPVRVAVTRAKAHEDGSPKSDDPEDSDLGSLWHRGLGQK